MLSTVKSIKLTGIEPTVITVEVDITSGIGIHLVGLADIAVKESLLRTVTALQSRGFHIPGKKVVINLAPADLSKSGSGYDLAIALGVISASGQHALPNLDEWLVLGELGLDASVRGVPGALQAILATRDNGLRGCIVPQANVNEFAELLRDEVPVYAAGSLDDAIHIIEKTEDTPTAWDWYSMQRRPAVSDPSIDHWSLLKGQVGAKRALEIAAAGAHPLLLMGAPGSGKSAVAKTLVDLLPPLTKEESIEIAKIYSASGHKTDVKRRPFRAPHYSASKVAIFGGGCGENIQPGEVSLAHNGVFFLDEACECPKALQDMLRVPLEDKQVVISRLKSKVTYPAHFHFVAAMNPCPCGYYGEGSRCTCTPGQRYSYQKALSGPILDRLTLMVWLHPLSKEAIENAQEGEPLSVVAERVQKARERQAARYKGTAYRTNEDVQHKDADKYFSISEEQKELIDKLFTHTGISVRSYLPILKLARTIADLSGDKDILSCHLAEAIGYRFLDRIQKEEI